MANYNFRFESCRRFLGGDARYLSGVARDISKNLRTEQVGSSFLGGIERGFPTPVCNGRMVAAE
jgi:hypothetical protein